MKKIRFGITGSGYMGRTHAEAIKRLGPRAELVAIWGGSRAPALAKRYGVVSETHLGDLIARSDIDAIVVTTPHACHVAEGIQALESGKHIMVEKPLATSVEDCDRLVRAADHRGLVLAVAYVQRFRRNCIRARELIAADAIGRVLTIQATMGFDLASFKSGGFGGTWQWWEDPSSIGYLINSLPHAIDLIRWFTDARITSISAICHTFIPNQTTEDTTMALAGLSNGTICSLFSTRAFPAPAFPGEATRLRLMGSTGLMDLDPYGDLRLSNEQGWKTVSTQPAVGYDDADAAFGDVRMQAFTDQMQSFIDGIEGKPMIAGSGSDGRAGIAACSAMLASSQDRGWVDL